MNNVRLLMIESVGTVTKNDVIDLPLEKYKIKKVLKVTAYKKLKNGERFYRIKTEAFGKKKIKTFSVFPEEKGHSRIFLMVWAI